MTDSIKESVIDTLRGLLEANQHLNESGADTIALNYTSFAHIAFGINPDVAGNGDRIMSMCFTHQQLAKVSSPKEVAEQLFFSLSTFNQAQACA
jgi:hypothetical protein